MGCNAKQKEMEKWTSFVIDFYRFSGQSFNENLYFFYMCIYW